MRGYWPGKRMGVWNVSFCECGHIIVITDIGVRNCPPSEKKRGVNCSVDVTRLIPSLYWPVFTCLAIHPLYI